MRQVWKGAALLFEFGEVRSCVSVSCCAVVKRQGWLVSTGSLDKGPTWSAFFDTDWKLECRLRGATFRAS